MRKTKTYKKGFSGWLARKVDRVIWFRGWEIVEEREVTKFNPGKAGLLFFIAPILALFGRSKYIEVTYEKI